VDDRQIIELYHRRDETAITETAGKYGDYCFCIANNILMNRQDSEECVNDTWLNTWNAIPPQQPNHLKLFLAKITRNLSLNRYKYLRRDKRGGGEFMVALEEISELVSGASDMEQEIAKMELIHSINLFLHTLAERDCNVFIRRYFHFDSTAKIAQMYHLNEGNVLKILSRTRSKLKTYLETEGLFI